MTPKPMRCTKCGCWVNFTYFDTAGQHWVCPECGNNSENQTIIYSTTTKSRRNNNGEIQKETSSDRSCSMDRR